MLGSVQMCTVLFGKDSCCTADSTQQVPHEDWINVDKMQNSPGIDQREMRFVIQCTLKKITQILRLTLSYPLHQSSIFFCWHFALIKEEQLHSVSSPFNGHWVPGWTKTHSSFGYWAERNDSEWTKIVLSLYDVGASTLHSMSALSTQCPLVCIWEI